MLPKHLPSGQLLHVPPKNSGKFYSSTNSNNLGLYFEPTIEIFSYVLGSSHTLTTAQIVENNAGAFMINIL